ncbi:MAG: DEAD/DEAH box helicase, partial [Coleofasciculus sp. C2-GNP5-27]
MRFGQTTIKTFHNREGIVVVAPTGSGKTEVFLMPLIYAIAQSIRQNPAHPHRFITLYPRVALLKDQLARIFRYVHRAEQEFLKTGQLSLLGSQTIEQGIIIGFQFRGVCAEAKDTLDNRDIFEEDGTFKIVHLYYSIYGVHIHNLINRLEEWQNGQRLAKIASSATVSEPQRFAANFFYGEPTHPVLVHDAGAKDREEQFIYQQEPAGLEVLYFLQSPEGRTNAGAAPTLIQSVMAMGHGVLGNDNRAIVFSDSLDMAGRLTAQIQDAEENKRLWEFRTISDAIRFRNITCPGTPPRECPIYLAGECWRGILGEQECFQLINALREVPLRIISVSSKQQNDYQESLTELSTTFIPYKTVYRYRPNPDSQPNPNISYLTVLNLEHRPEWVSDDRETVTIRLRSEGVTRGGIQFPKKVYVKFLESDSQGQQIVAFCPRCYGIHNIRHNRCNCHEELQRVKLYTQPIVERSSEALVEPRPITRSLSIIDQMRGNTIVRGSSVEARRVFWDAEVRYYRYIANVHPYSFDALYDTPIQYGIPTKGITWNLASVVEQILPDNNLRQQVEQVVIDGTHKELNEELVLHTASHLLHRAIASISGVNEQELEYSYNEA